MGEKPAIHHLRGLDVAEAPNVQEKAVALKAEAVQSVEQAKQLENPDARVALGGGSQVNLFLKYATAYQGITTGDNPQYVLFFWELSKFAHRWSAFQSTGDKTCHYSGQCQIFLWESGQGYLASSNAARIQGQAAWINPKTT